MLASLISFSGIKTMANPGKDPGGTTVSATSGLTASMSTTKPFAEQATVNYSIDEAAPVTATLYNNVGEPIAQLMDDRMHVPGSYQLQIPGEDLKPGLYFLRFEAYANPTVVRMVKAVK